MTTCDDPTRLRRYVKVEKSGGNDRRDIKQRVRLDLSVIRCDAMFLVVSLSPESRCAHLTVRCLTLNDETARGNS